VIFASVLMARGMSDRKLWADLQDSSCDDLSECEPPKKRIAWADLHDSSCEDCLESQMPPPVLNTDSYIETPEPSFDHVDGSVLHNWKAATALNSTSPPAAPVAPQDMVFWQPNPLATKFIPAVFHPAVPLLCDQGRLFAEAPEQAAVSTMVQVQDVRPREDVVPSTTPVSRHRFRHRRRDFTLSARGGHLRNKRVRNDDTRGSQANSTVDEFITEEDWHRRNAKRVKVVEAIKTTPEYETMSGLRAQGQLVCAPSTPNAHDRSVSKRKWEAEVMQWRNGIKELRAASGA